MPATEPWMMRLKISTESFGLSPASMSAPTNTLMAITNVLRWPKLWISHALTSMPMVIAASAPVDSHCTRSCPMPKAPMMSGSATLTMVVVSMAEIVPIITVMVTSQR